MPAMYNDSVYMLAMYNASYVLCIIAASERAKRVS